MSSEEKKKEMLREKGFLARIKQKDPNLYQMIEYVAKTQGLSEFEALLYLANIGVQVMTGQYQLERMRALLEQAAQNPSALAFALEFWKMVISDYLTLAQTGALGLQAISSLDQIISQKVQQELSKQPIILQYGTQQVMKSMVSPSERFLEILAKGLSLAEQFIRDEKAREKLEAARRTLEGVKQ